MVQMVQHCTRWYNFQPTCQLLANHLPNLPTSFQQATNKLPTSFQQVANKLPTSCQQVANLPSWRNLTNSLSYAGLDRTKPDCSDSYGQLRTAPDSILDNLDGVLDSSPLRLLQSYFKAYFNPTSLYFKRALSYVLSYCLTFCLIVLRSVLCMYICTPMYTHVHLCTLMYANVRKCTKISVANEPFFVANASFVRKCTKKSAPDDALCNASIRSCRLGICARHAPAPPAQP